MKGIEDVSMLLSYPGVSVAYDTRDNRQKMRGYEMHERERRCIDDVDERM